MVDIYQYLDAWFEGKHSDSLQHIGCYSKQGITRSNYFLNKTLFCIKCADKK